MSYDSSPVNAAAGRVAARIYHDLRKLDRLDLLEALGIEQRGTRLDWGYDHELEIYELEVQLLDQKIEAAERTRQDLEDLTSRYTRGPDELTTYDWIQLLDIASRDLPSLEKWDGIICAGSPADGRDSDPAEADGGPCSADLAHLQLARSEITRALEATHGSVLAAVGSVASYVQRTVARCEAERAALRPPLSDDELAKVVASRLIGSGYLDRLARPRTSVHRSLRHLSELFKTFQALGPDDHEPEGD